MKTKGVVVLMVVASLVLAASFVLAMNGEGEHGPPWEGWQGSEGWGMGQKYQKLFDPDTVEIVSGVVVGVEKITPMEGMSSGVHLLLKTEEETIPVHLGPVWFIQRLDTKIVKGDKVEVKGSRVKMMGVPTIIAAEIKKGDSVIILRDENGVPVWSGRRMK